MACESPRAVSSRSRVWFPLRAPLDAIASIASFAGAPLFNLVRETRSRPHPPRASRRSLRSSVYEGMTAEVVGASSSGAALTAWALYLGASPVLIALLAALPYLSQLVQFPSAWLTSRVGARKVALVATSISRQALWPLVPLPFLPVGQATKLVLLLIVAAVSALFSIVGNNGWTTWMGDLVPRRLRGRYFGRRTAICMLVGSFATLGAGLALDVATRHGREGWALASLGLVAVLAGALSTVLMARQHEPGAAAREPLTFETATRPFRDPGARRLLAFLVPWNFAIGLSSAFFVVFMLENLRMGFALIALQGIGTAVVRLLAAPLWGRATDRLGPRPVLVACSFLIVGIPLLWLLPTPTRLWPVAADALASGVLWSGHNLATFHMPLAVAPRQGRSFYLAAFSTLSGVAFAIAATAGGWLVGAMPATIHLGRVHWANLQLLFLFSIVLRLGSAFLSLRTTEPSSKPVRDLGRLVASASRPWATPAPGVQNRPLGPRRRAG